MTPEQIEAHYRAWWATAHPGAAPPSVQAVGNAREWARQLLEERLKVFAVFEDDYDIRRLRAVFSSPDAAATFQRFVDLGQVPEEHVIDSESPPDWWDSSMSYFRCWRRNNTPHGLSAQVECYICSPGSWPALKKDVDWNDDGVFQVMAGIGTRVVARTEKDAIQIAQDRFNRFLESTDIFQR